MVPCCNECNCLAGNTPFVSILEKRKFIQQKLADKYKSQSRRVIWDDDELDEFGYSLGTSVRHYLVQKHRIDKRLAWPAVRTTKEKTRKARSIPS